MRRVRIEFEMKRYLPTLLALTALGAGCRHATRNPVPLAPAIHLMETVPPGSIVALVLDAHSGAPLADAVAMVPGTPLRAVTDSTGILRLESPRRGAVELNIRHVGYVPWHSTVSVPESAGVALVVQLRRSDVRLTEVCTTEARAGIVVTVVDSVTGDPPATATFVARSGAWADSSLRATLPGVGTQASELVWDTAWERPGTYDVTVRSPGYRDWIRTRVRVTAETDACHHVRTTRLTARLQR